MYQPCCLVPGCQGKLGELRKKQLTKPQKQFILSLGMQFGIQATSLINLFPPSLLRTSYKDMDSTMVVVAGDDSARLGECRRQGSGVAEVQDPRLDAGDAPRLRHQHMGGVPCATNCHNDRHPAGGPQCCLGYSNPTGVLFLGGDLF